VSLLIDALRQAEQSRRETTANPDLPVAEAGLQIEPRAVQELPLPAKIEPTIASGKTKAAPSQDQRAAVQRMFEAKQESSSKTPMLLVVLAAAIAIIAGLGYLWWATQPRSQITLANTPVSATLAENAIPGTVPARPQAEKNPTPLDAQTTVAPVSRVQQPQRTPKQVAPARGEESKLTVTTLSGQTPLHFSRTNQGEGDTRAPLKQAYAAYISGNFADAYRFYLETLRQDPKNSDALTGLGMLSLQAGRQDEANRYFREALNSDPKNTVAQAQLLSIQGETDPLSAESHLQNLIAEQADAPSLYFALGNLYVRQARWKEAQQSFFQAYTLDGKNPDILYNLAVSLDHLHQTKLARQFYERAATSGEGKSLSFDPGAASKRAQQLANTTAGN